MSTDTTANGKKKYENRLLADLEDYAASVNPDFSLVGNGDIEEIASILGQSDYNNVIYVGQSGVGKSATIFGIAEKKKAAIANPETAGKSGLPLHMIDRRFMILDVDALFDEDDPVKIQADIKKIFAELEKPGNYVLVIEDANDFLNGIQNHQCHGLVSGFMRELKKGAFQTVWMVREEPGKTKLENVLNCHSEMTELFTVLRKDPPERDEVLQIMKASRQALERHFDGLAITEEADQEIVNLTYAYPSLSVYMREQPARSLRIRDRIASTFVSQEQARPAGMAAMQADLETLEKKLAESKDDAVLQTRKIELETKIAEEQKAWDDRARKLFIIYGKRREVEAKIETAEIALQKLSDDLRVSLTSELGHEPSVVEFDNRKTPAIKEKEQDIRASRKDLEEKILPLAQKIKGDHNTALTLDAAVVRKAFSEISGIPASDMNKDEAEKVMALPTRMKSKVFGQDAVVDTIAGSVKRAKAGLKDPSQPIGIYVCLGASGTGKSYVSECLAEFMFDDPKNMTTFDMSEYMEKHTVANLKGAPKGYAGYGEGGMLTNAVREKPYQVILFDEVEKAHPDIFKITLQVFDKGRLTDEKGTVDFRNTIIILTTNLGQDLSLDESIDPESDETQDKIKEALREHGFPQEWINRVDGFLLFRAHQPESIHKILRRDIDGINKQIADKGFTVEVSDADIDTLITERYKREEGARQVKKFLAEKLKNKVADVVLGNKDGGTIKAAYQSGQSGFLLEVVPKGQDIRAMKSDLQFADVHPAPAGAPLAGLSASTRAAFAPM